MANYNSIQHESEIVNGISYIVKAAHLIDNFNGIKSNLLDLLSRINPLNQTVLSRILYNGPIDLNNQLVTKQYVDDNAGGGGGFPPGYFRGGEFFIPLDWSDSGGGLYNFNNNGPNEDLLFQPIVCQDNQDLNIINTGGAPLKCRVTKNYSLSVGDPIGGYVQSENLTGTVATTNGSTQLIGTATEFFEEYIQHDVITIGANSYWIESIVSDTELRLKRNAVATVTGQTHKRGGLPVEAILYPYLIQDAAQEVTTVIVSSRCTASPAQPGQGLPDLPSGWKYRRIPGGYRYAGSNVSGNGLVYARVVGGWPTNPKLRAFGPSYDYSGADGNRRIYTGVINNGTRELDLRPFVPMGAASCKIRVQYDTVTTGGLLRLGGFLTSSLYYQAFDTKIATGENGAFEAEICLDPVDRYYPNGNVSTGKFDMRANFFGTGATGTFYIDILEYTFSELD